MKITYSELFQSIQGEGPLIGVPQIWLRFANCNLQCNGFGQDDPTDISSYKLPYQEINLENIKRVEDLPVFETGCDSSYTWSKRFKHLMKQETPYEVAERMVKIWEEVPLNRRENYGITFTGGEPLLKNNAKGLIKIIEYISVITDKNWFPFVTIETNGTQPPLNLPEGFDQLCRVLYSISPKLFSVSGESKEKAIDINNIEELLGIGAFSYLKFVVTDTQECQDELEEIVSELDVLHNKFIYLMPVGATREQQEEDHVFQIAEYCVDNNYNFCPRVHCQVYGNVIGT